jgi:hypothetical protein
VVPAEAVGFIVCTITDCTSCRGTGKIVGKAVLSYEEMQAAIVEKYGDTPCTAAHQFEITHIYQMWRDKKSNK